jgi:hypothetical protein
VQPHEPCAFAIINGSLPVFLNVNSTVPLSPLLIVPKSCRSFVNVISAELAGADAALTSPTTGDFFS